MDTILEDEGVSDLEYLKSRMRQESIDDEDKDAGEEVPLSDDSSAGQGCVLDGLLLPFLLAIFKPLQEVTRRPASCTNQGDFSNAL